MSEKPEGIELPSEEFVLPAFDEEDDDDSFVMPQFDDDDDEFTLSHNFTDPSEDEDEFELPLGGPTLFVAEDEDEDSFALALYNQVTSLSEFVIDEQKEITYYVSHVEHIRKLKGEEKLNVNIITERLHQYLDIRLKTVYPGYLASFTSTQFKRHQNLIEFLRSEVITAASDYVNCEDGDCEVFSFAAMQKVIFKIFVHERVEIVDSAKVVEEITSIAASAYETTVSWLTASNALEASDQITPVYPEQIYPNGYLCECGHFQKTKHPIPAIFSTAARTILNQEEVKCDNCKRTIVIPSEIADVLVRMLEAAIDHFPVPPPNTYYIYRPAMELLQVPPHLSELLIFDEVPEEEDEEEENETSQNISSLYKDLVNDWTREFLSGKLTYLQQLFNSKTFNFNVQQEWKDWSATVLHYLEHNGVFALTPWADAKYHYTKQQFADAQTTYNFIDKYAHWLSGIKTVKAAKELPAFKREYLPIMRELFMYRCLSKTINWTTSGLKRIMTKDDFSLSIAMDSKKYEGIAECSPGRILRQDKKVLKSIKVFEDLETLQAVLDGEQPPPMTNEMTPMREWFDTFIKLLTENAETCFATSMTDLATVCRAEIIRFMDKRNLLSEKTSPVFEHYNELEVANEVDYRLLTYLKYSENLPASLLDIRRFGTLEDLQRTLRNDSELMEELIMLNEDWREVL